MVAQLYTSNDCGDIHVQFQLRNRKKVDKNRNFETITFYQRGLKSGAQSEKTFSLQNSILRLLRPT